MTDNRTSADDTESNAGGGAWRAGANVLGVLILVALLVPFVVYAVPGVVGADAGYVVLSGSMEPAMSPGDVIVVEEVPPSSISAGDVVTFATESEARPTTHRVIEVVQTEQGLAFRTKGDANEDPDPALVTAGQVRGVVPTVGGHLFVIPLVGYIIQFAGTTTGILTLLVAPLALLVLSEAYVLVRSSRDGDDTSEGSTDPADPSSEQGDPAAANTPGSGADSVPATGAVSATAEGKAESAASAVDEQEDEDQTEDEGFTLTPMDLRLTVGVLFLFTAYAAWVAYATLEVWAVTGATTVGATLVLVGAMYLFGGSASDGEDAEAAAAAATVATPAAGPSGRRRKAVYDGGSEAPAEAPWVGADGPVLGEPAAGVGPRERTTESPPTDIVPRSPAGPAEPAVVAVSPETETATEPARESPNPPVPDGPELEAAIVPVDDRKNPATTAEPARRSPEPAVPDGPELEAAVVPVEDSQDPAATADTPVESEEGGEEPGNEGPRLTAGNPLIAVPFALLYYIGYVVVEPPRFVYRSLAAVRGGGSSD